MLTLLDRSLDRNCQGYCRREFLKIGALSMFGGLSLSNLLASKASAAPASRFVKDKAVVLLFLHGGPSHIETFDPKMNAPAEVRGIFGEVPTALPGITFGATFPKLAKMADRIAVVRSYGSKNGDHSYLSVSGGGNPLKASMSALYTRVAGAIHPRTGLPNNVLVLPEAVQPGLKLGSNFETGALPTLTATGDLGPAYSAFDPSAGGEFKKTMQLQMEADRFGDRRALLGELDALRRRADAANAWESMDRFQQQAFDLVARGVADAFDVSKEDPKVIEKYDTSKLFRLEEVTKWFDMRRATNQLGKQMLLARRLIESGVGFVTVSDCGWDHHANENSPKNMGGFAHLGGQVDHAVAAFLEDLAERGLSDKVLLIVTGEMGRSPRRNRNGGRDHYGELTPLLLAGGGLRMGQVIGSSDASAARASSEPLKPAHLLSTVMHTILDTTAVRAEASLGKAADVLTGGEPIPGLL